VLRSINASLAALKADQAQIGKKQTATTRGELGIVRFLQNIPEIVGTDLRIYGPYNKEDVGSLPIENARALVKQGAAKPIDVKGLSQHLD
jgi:DNA replication initiation complex subunit (GINS family)